MTTEFWAMGLVLFAALIGSFGPILIKKSVGKLRFSLKSFFTNYYLIGGIFFYGISTIIFIPALKGGELSVLYPFVASVYVWVSILSMIILKEKMNSYKWFGVFMIILGVTFIGFGS